MKTRTAIIPDFRPHAAPGTRRLALYCLAALAAVAFAALPATPKDKPLKKDYALIFGTVWGPEQRPVQGVAVKIRRANDKRARWEQVSDRRGEFAQRVPAGKADYIVWAEPKSKKNKALTEVTVHIESDERVDIGLHLTE